MWKKVLYVAVALIFGFIVAVIAYNSNQFNNILDLVSTALVEEKYDELPKIFGGVHDTNEIINEKEEKAQVLVYNGTAVTDLNYGEDSTRFMKYEGAYYIYILHPSFSTIDISEGETTVNKSAFVFTADNGNEYTYYMIANANVNADYYVAESKTLEDVLLKPARDLASPKDSWGFMSVNVTETMVKYISEALGGKITGMNIVDNEGNVVGKYAVNFDFSQQFFTDIKELVTNYNVWLEAYVANEKVEEAEATFTEFYNPWLENFNANTETTGYSFRYEDSYLSPNKILWQTVGMMALYSLVIVVFYVIIFHFSAIRNIFSKDTYKDYGKKNGKKTTYIAPVRKVNTEENKEEKVEVLEEPKENPQE